MRPRWLLWGPTKASRSIFYMFKFRNSIVEKEFQEHCSNPRVMLATAYFTFAALLNTAHLSSYVGVSPLPISFWLFLTDTVLPIAALILLHAIQPMRHRVVLLHAGVALTSMLVSSSMMSTLAQEWLSDAVSQLENNLPTSVVEQVSDPLSISFANQARVAMSYDCQFHLYSLAFMGFNFTTIPVWLTSFCAFVLATSLTPRQLVFYVGVYSSGLFLSIIPFITLCIWMEVLLRRNFHSQQSLKHELDISQMAEGMLNNTVKNALADAVANIQECLNAGSHAAESLLRETLAGLARGMRCCRQRQAFLALVSDTYVPHFLKVNLQEFGADLVAGRDVVGDFVDSQVLIDPLLCTLVLDNAIAQAFHHGHSECPDVQVRIFPEGSFFPITHTAVQMIFEVSFFCRDEDLDMRYCEGLAQLKGPTPAHNLTQRHLKLAADAHGMSLRWFREEDRIYFRATCTAQLVEPQRRLELPPKPVLDAFPRQLTFYIIDDSAAARRLLASCITRSASPAAVHCFGACPQDVHQFVGAACLDGDIVICDQHLDYGEQHYLGTDLIRSLKDRGFQGLICVRSADMDDRERDLYHASGAHCAFGKEELCREVVERIKAAYVELKGLPAREEAAASPGASLGSDAMAIRPLNSPALSVVEWGSIEHLPSLNADEFRQFNVGRRPFGHFPQWPQNAPCAS